MKCFKCEKEIQGQVKYCPRCGTYPPQILAAGPYPPWTSGLPQTAG